MTRKVNKWQKFDQFWEWWVSVIFLNCLHVLYYVLSFISIYLHKFATISSYITLWWANVSITS
jgi:hypothetical protein